MRNIFKMICRMLILLLVLGTSSKLHAATIMYISDNASSMSGLEEYPVLTQQESAMPMRSRWEAIKGRRARNALLLGMWSIHMDGGGEVFGGRYNEQNHMFAIRYAGLAVGTFVNSHYDRTYYAGFARELSSSVYGSSGGVRMDTGYDIGLMQGYGDNLPNLWGISPQFRFTFGMTWRNLGIDFGWAPVLVATVNFRVDL